MSLFSRLRAVVSGDDYLDGDYDDELDYDAGSMSDPAPMSSSRPTTSGPLALSTAFSSDGHQERVGESIFLFAPSCVTVTTASGEEVASPTVLSNRASAHEQQEAAPSPAWGRTDSLA